MANELSPMAGETFAFNLFGENLSQYAIEKKKTENVLWLRSMYSDTNLKNRLRENPFEFPKGKNSDISSKTSFSNKLIIGNIDHLLHFLALHRSACQQLRKQNIDLLSGGPPCHGGQFGAGRA